MAPRDVRYDNLLHTPLRYLRASPVRTPYPIESTFAFKARLENWWWDAHRNRPAWAGNPLYVATAGAYVSKPGAHGLGRAFDLDRVVWENFSVSPYDRDHASPSRTVRRKYLGLECFCRRWFNYVLDANFNAAHRDHLHLDDVGGALVLYTQHRSAVTFCQFLCNDLRGYSLAVDGLWGPRTHAAMLDAQHRSGVPGDLTADSAAWRQFLLVCGTRAMSDAGL